MAPTPKVACLVGAAIPSYPVTGTSSIQYAATVIAARCCLSPAVALRVVELIGMGGNL
jgi:hypothetical protein